MRVMLLGILSLIPTLAVADGPGVDDRFAGEPSRPKAEAPVRFGRSWAEARAEASRGGRRLLVVFTGEHCGWCRALEKRTFTDAEVVSLSREFVCVELDTGDEDNARLVEEYRIDSIPRSLVLDAEGRIVTRRTGYLPAAEYADWLKDARTRAVAAVNLDPPAKPPAAVGASESEADVVIWSVDSTRSVARWGDEDWVGHAQLLRVLRAAGLRPRVEHMARDRFPARWDEAVGRGPEIVVADQSGGLILDLARKGALISISSDRLAWSPENASCPDFAGRSAFVAARSRNEGSRTKALDALLRPGPNDPLPGPELADAASRVEAEEIARAAASAFLRGDAPGLRAVASADSPQLARCARPEDFRLGRAVTVGPVEIRGNAAVAFARVEARWEGPTSIGADAVLAVLRRESSEWKAFAVSADITALRELPALCRIGLREAAGADPPPTPRLLEPADGTPMGVGKSFVWEVPDRGPLAAQICQVLLDNDEAHGWPEMRLKVEPGAPRARSIPYAEAARGLAGVTSPRMYWCVWAIGPDGRIAASDVRRYLEPRFQY